MYGNGNLCSFKSKLSNQIFLDRLPCSLQKKRLVLLATVGTRQRVDSSCQSDSSECDTSRWWRQLRLLERKGGSGRRWVDSFKGRLYRKVVKVVARRKGLRLLVRGPGVRGRGHLSREDLWGERRMHGGDCVLRVSAVRLSRRVDGRGSHRPGRCEAVAELLTTAELALSLPLHRERDRMD